MEVFILGCGGMMPLPNRHLTSMLVRRDGDLLLFDCGEATQISLKKLNLRWKKIKAIFISHTHADHITGLPGMLMLSSQVHRDEPLYIIGPPKVKAYVEAQLDTLDMYINYQIVIIEIDPYQREVVFEDEAYVVRNFPLYHRRVCVGYSIEEKPRAGVFHPDRARALGIPEGPLWGKLQRGQSVENQAGETIKPSQVIGAPRSGRKISFVTDTLYNPSIAKDVFGSDLLICEGMFTQELLASAQEKHHLIAKQSGQIAKDAQVKQMGLIHYSPRYMDWELPKLLQEAQSIFPNTFLSRDRMHLHIPHQEDETSPNCQP
ncbi:ribonuclease Z [Entomospira culicis]|uniref:Ribonuclease Z n=1 Tax=Entomospira culicis TaxID=2719989 RepID=A0A968GEL9_9SPIO|nr:ribonuclease Z [Entomospira culicis]NIZ18632.1 ribonuclease Z [Entomospira culicis]NIZ68847.1 ribonuclease Z [Entomospira culicis]WDI37441.1 ribonuclease Z [Entomospira culicis]WDI39069.1 ribonuclease Z [Entomospira culicis]